MTLRTRAILRIRIITTVILTLAVILVARLYQIQVLNHDQYVARAEQQYVHTVQDVYDRGSIFMTTREGERVSAATVRGGYVLAVDPTVLTDVAAAWTAIAPHVQLDEALFRTRATLPDRTYVELAEALPEEAANAIAAADIDGLFLYQNQWRYYPGETLAARTIGFTGFDADSPFPTGRYGLERYYEDILNRDPETLSVDFFAEIFSTLGDLLVDESDLGGPRPGHIVTSLEPTVSRLLQQTLEQTNEQWSSRITGGIIMNPQTGAIYALDAVPTFDLNNREGASITDFQNPLVENVYEMGSIIKPLTVAAGLDAGAIAPNTTYYDSGRLELDTFTIGNFDGKGRGTVNMQEVLNQSLNTGVAFIVDTMGKERFREYFLNLKLGSETGIDLPNEAFGLVSNLNSPRDVEYATASFGQGIALTPVGTVRALSTLANGGRLVTPHLVQHVEYEDGTLRDVTYPNDQQVFSSETSEEISRMLTSVVDDALRNGTVALPNHTIAAKTGTAQIADSVNGGYYDDRYLHSFFGYFPAYNPEFLVFLYTVEPKGVRYASETLTEPFMDITRFLINYYAVAPDR
ncbi:MAG TPA: penicillin-binding protein 2 [Candidatus Paceibacterota bacterium]|nr:penicillin-binding protein 2 [Candidatus Paceibacterota bacterium]